MGRVALTGPHRSAISREVWIGPLPLRSRMGHHFSDKQRTVMGKATWLGLQ